MTYAAYLRIYEPVSAFHEPDRSRWAAYAASSERPRRRDSLMVEHAEALRRAIAAPPIVVRAQAGGTWPGRAPGRVARIRGRRLGAAARGGRGDRSRTLARGVSPVLARGK